MLQGIGKSWAQWGSQSGIDFEAVFQVSEVCLHPNLIHVAEMRIAVWSTAAIYALFCHLN